MAYYRYIVTGWGEINVILFYSILELVLRHPMRVSNYFVDSFYSVFKGIDQSEKRRVTIIQ